MLGCWKVRGLLAASIYEELNAEDQAALDAHLSDCARCGEKLEAFRRVKSAAPVEPVRLQFDIMPLIRRRLRETPAREFAFRPVPMAAGAAALVLVGVSAMMLYPASGPSNDVESLTSTAASPLDSTFDEVGDLEERRDYMAAYLQLVDGVATHPQDIRSGEAQQQLADLAFTELSMYEQALGAYQALRSEYGEVWRANVEHNFLRLELLEESRGSDNTFASLYQLDAARASSEFEAFEAIVGRNQLTYVADLAIEEMALLMLEASGGPSENDYVVAMEAALDSCSNPAAIAMLKYKLGDLIHNGGGDLERAQRLFEQVAEDDAYPALASLAQESLRTMDSN